MRSPAALVLVSLVACGPRGARGDAPRAPADPQHAPPPPASASPAVEGGIEFCGRTWAATETAVECHDPAVEQIDALAQLPELRVVDLMDTAVGDLTPIEGLTRLEDLYVKGTRVESLAALAALDLELLDASGTAVSDLSPLASMTRLQDLRMMTTKVTDLHPLAGLRSLEALDLRQTAVSDLRPLSALPAMRELLVMDCPVESLEPLRAIRSLEVVDIGGTPVRSLAPLRELPRLRELDVNVSAVSPAEVEAFRRARPSVVIHADYVEG